MLRQIRVTDGSEVFSILLGSNVASSVLLDGDVAYLGTFDNQVVAVDLKAQKKLWTYEHPERKFAYYASPTMTDELILIGGRDKMLHGIERSTGKSKWTFRVRGKVDSSPVVSGEHVIFGDTTGRIFLLRHIDGKEVWRFDMGAAAVASPAIADGKVVWGFTNGQIVCFGKKG